MHKLKWIEALHFMRPDISYKNLGVIVLWLDIRGIISITDNPNDCKFRTIRRVTSCVDAVRDAGYIKASLPVGCVLSWPTDLTIGVVIE